MIFEEFSELRLTYYEFSKIKSYSGINKRFSKKEKHTARHVVPSGRATCHADVSITSAWGPPNACVIMAFDDVSIDLVNVDQVNTDVMMMSVVADPVLTSA